MYSKKDILKHLVEYNYFIDENTLNNFIKNWKIEAIYEDEDGVEFFDNLSIVKIKKGISLKSQGYDNSQIIYHIGKILSEKMPEKENVVAKKEIPAAVEGEMKNLTIDVTSQTLQMLADAVAEKITSGIKEQIQSSEFVQQLLEDSSLKKDNESLSRQVEELLEDNKKLAQRIEEIERGRKMFPFNFKDLRKFLR